MSPELMEVAPTVVVSFAWDPTQLVRGIGARKGFQDYWSSIAAQAATLLHVAPDARFVACTNAEPDPKAAATLQTLGAEVRMVEFEHRPPPEFHHRYRSALYLLDTMVSQAAAMDSDEVVFFSDPDVAWPRRPTRLVEGARAGGVVGYDLHVPADLQLVARTRDELAAIAREILPGIDPEPGPYFGGEFYGMTGSVLTELVAETEPVWDATLERFEQGLPYFHLEEHVLNAVLWNRGERSGRANPYFQRIQTRPQPFGTRERDHHELEGLHLPLEKERGLPRLHRHVDRGGELPPAGPEFEGWLRRRLGVDASSRQVFDRSVRLKWRLQRRRPDIKSELGL